MNVRTFENKVIQRICSKYLSPLISETDWFYSNWMLNMKSNTRTSRLKRVSTFHKIYWSNFQIYAASFEKLINSLFNSYEVGACRDLIRSKNEISVQVFYSVNGNVSSENESSVFCFRKGVYVEFIGFVTWHSHIGFKIFPKKMSSLF